MSDESMLPSTLPQLETDRLILRNLEVADADSFQAMCQDEDMARGTGVIPYPYPDGAAAKWIEQQLQFQRDDTRCTFVITLKPTGQILGNVSVDFVEGQLKAEIGYIVGREFKGSGMASEAVQRVVRWYFESTSQLRLFAHCFCFNLASARILEKAGFQREGLLRQHHCTEDRVADDFVYGLLRSDWESNQLEPTT